MKKVFTVLLFAFFSLYTLQVQSQTKQDDLSYNFCLIQTNCKTLKEANRTAGYINSQGGQVAVIGTPNYFIGWVSPDKFSHLTGKNSIISITNTIYTPEKSAVKNNNEMVIINYYNSVINKEYLNEPETEVDMEALGNDCFFKGKNDFNYSDYLKNLQNLRGKGKGTNELLAHTYCDNSANSEYMKGTIACAVFFVESDGTVDADSYTWTTAHEDSRKTEVISAWTYLSNTASSFGASLTFSPVYFDHTTPTVVNQPYEPVTRNSYQEDNLWINACLGHLGITSGDRDTRVNAYNTYLRDSLGVEHTYCCFVGYNPNGDKFANNYTAYAWHGGPYCQLLYICANPFYKSFAHESGHVFHAFDEYSGSYDGCTASFNGVINDNFHGSPCNGSSSCLMVSITTSGSKFATCAYTPAHLGWTSDLTPAPVPASPADNASVGDGDNVFSWNRNTTNTSIYTYLIIYNALTDEQIYCSNTTSDNMTAYLSPGEYKWTLINGNSNHLAGYAMMPCGEMRNLTVIASTPHPDLVIENQSCSPSTIRAGVVALASCDVKNQGTADGGSSTLKYYLSDNITYESGDMELGSASVGSLSMGTSNSQSKAVTVPKGTAAGTWYILYYADASAQVEETNESNNVAYFTITVDTTSTVSCTNTITSFPYNEGFESGLGYWEQNIDDECDWTRYNYPTSSNYTGPEAAHGGSYYLYTEASDCYNNKVAILTGPCFDFSSYGSAELSFWYHMFSEIIPEEMGTMEVQISLDGGVNWSAGIWSLSENQGSIWKNAIVDLTPYVGQIVMLRFKGTTGPGSASDMAIDDVNVTVGAVTVSPDYGNNIHVVKIYPNPARNSIYVVLPEKTGKNAKITVYNVLGETISDMTNTYSGTCKIDISSMPEGVYYLTVKSDDTTIGKKFSVIK